MVQRAFNQRIGAGLAIKEASGQTDAEWSKNVETGYKRLGGQVETTSTRQVNRIDRVAQVGEVTTRATQAAGITTASASRQAGLTAAIASISSASRIVAAISTMRPMVNVTVTGVPGANVRYGPPTGSAGRSDNARGGK